MVERFDASDIKGSETPLPINFIPAIDTDQEHKEARRHPYPAIVVFNNFLVTYESRLMDRCEYIATIKAPSQLRQIPVNMTSANTMASNNVKNGVVAFDYTPRNDNPADLLTKPLNQHLITRFFDAIGLRRLHMEFRDKAQSDSEGGVAN
ncbi:hypothetical protein QFC21_006365 [Naganishia friedmannii]|uniref:Uncharacterized protein n=1 Tax=Naganishia friedmannii TaxID=89922 RepID=A0ACC2V3D3_9TREE|nr:hypothetical protein QFC21_006365 [Naganishia friedmannii]